ncbi:MAG: integrase [candidate division WOR-3 bacterium]
MLNSALNPKSEWFGRVNVDALSGDVRRTILERVKLKLGFNEAVRALGIAKGSLHNYLTGKRIIPSSVISRALQYLNEYEFNEVVSGFDRLKALGIIKEDGSVDYPLILQAIALASRDEYLKHALLKFVVSNFKEDLRKMLDVSYAGLKMHWDKGFEEFLVTRKKRRQIKDPETMAYYRNLFMKHLEGKEISEELVDYVINCENKWLRNIFRHYVQYLYFRRIIGPEVFGWIMEVVPSRNYRMDVRPYPISIEDVIKTLDFLKKNHEKYYALYRLMLEGGIRLSHAIMLMETFKPDEVLEIPRIGLVTNRLVRFDDRNFCRYYLGVGEEVKPCEWAYFSIETLRLIEKYKGTRISGKVLSKYIRKHDLLSPKYMRKIAWRLMIQTISREVARFIQSRFGELKISELRYEDLLSEADQHYPSYITLLGSYLS